MLHDGSRADAAEAGAAAIREEAVEVAEALVSHFQAARRRRLRRRSGPRPAVESARASIDLNSAGTLEEQTQLARSTFNQHAGGDEYIDRDELRAMCATLGRELSNADLDAAPSCSTTPRAS